MTKEPEAVVLEPILVEVFERMVYSRQHEQAINELFSIIYRIKKGHGICYYGKRSPSFDGLYARIASAIAALLGDPQFGFTHEGFLRLMNDHPTLHGIFRASSYGSMDYVMDLFGTRDAETRSKLSFNSVFETQKFLICWSLDSEIEIDWDALTRNSPEWACPAMLAAISVGGVHSERAHERKIALLKQVHFLERAPLKPGSIQVAGDAYMHCSYVECEEKHDIKKILNKQMREGVTAMLPVKERTELTRKDKPTIVVPLEWFNSAHAMYRCYAHSIRQLRTKFRVVCVARESEMDAQAQSEFDKVVPLSGNSIALNEIIAAVESEQPDIMFYPSIGMSAWWVAISNFRLAPIQVMCPGHPATSHSAAIDYIVSDGDLFGDERHYSEKFVHLPVGGARYMKRDDVDLTKCAPSTDGKVRFAVPAMVMKLSAPFLKLAQRIALEAPHVEFHFFPNQISTGHILMEKELKVWIPECVVHARNTYQGYMETLAKCDVALSTFPFGGTNSVMDCFLLGIPVVTLEGDQIHSRSDASMIRRMGLPEWMIAHTEEEYFAAALRFANSGCDRANAAEYLRENDVESEFYGEGPPEVHNAFVAAFERIYKEKLDEQERRISERPRVASAGSGWGAYRRLAPAIRER